MKDESIEVIRSGNSREKAFITIAVGKNYLNDWNNICRRNWSLYCKKYNIDIILIKQPISSNDEKNHRTIHWDKLLIKRIPVCNEYEFVAWIDADIIINYKNAPDLFNSFDHSKIGAVSLMHDFPFDLKCAKKGLHI